MLVTDLAYRDMEAHMDGWVGRLRAFVRRLLGRPRTVAETEPPYRLAPEHRALIQVVSTSWDDRAPGLTDMVPTDDAFRWRRHPQLLRPPVAGTEHDSEALERGARSAAVRGLFLARSGRFDDARAAFAEAAAEPAVDLTATPGFWELSRAGMIAAVDAYEEVDRFREASTLGARIRLRYRPRPLPTIPGTPSHRTSASGG